MSTLPGCPECNSQYTYEDREFCTFAPECGHEWAQFAEEAAFEGVRQIRDANGNLLQDGDSITVIKDLKVKGTSLVVKVGTKVKISAWLMVTTILIVKSVVLVP